MMAGRRCNLCRKQGFTRTITMKSVRINGKKKWVCLECLKNDFKQCGSIKRDGNPCSVNVHKDEDYCSTHIKIEHKRKNPHLYCKECYEKPYKCSSHCLHHLEHRILTDYKKKVENKLRKLKNKNKLTPEARKLVIQKYTWQIDEKHMPRVIQMLVARCTYCGLKPKVGGLDRIDNMKCYTLDNIAPACSMCNKAKADKTRTQFYEMCVNVTDKLREDCNHIEVQGKNGRETQVILE